MPFTLPNRLPPTETDPAAPTCGRCGYCVRGIPGLICPECGSDLREVGIIPANKRGLLPKNLKLILWAFAFLPVAAAISLLLYFTVLPFAQMVKVDRQIQIQAGNFNTTIMVLGQHRPWQPVLMGVPPISPESFSVWSQNGRGLLEVTRTGSYSYFLYQNLGNTIQGQNLDGKAIADCFLPPTANLTDPQKQDLFDALSTVITQTTKGIGTNNVIPLLDRNGLPLGKARPIISFAVHDEPSPILIAVLVIFWLIIWIYGFRRILR